MIQFFKANFVLKEKLIILRHFRKSKVFMQIIERLVILKDIMIIVKRYTCSISACRIIKPKHVGLIHVRF